MKYHPGAAGGLTPSGGQRLAGSLTGAVASQSVTEAPKGPLRRDGNPPESARVKGGLTVRPASRAGAKAGPSEPVVPCGRAIDQRIKVTPGITG